MTVEEKIKIIETSRSYTDIPHEAMPYSHKEDYYFVSYSHKDYKDVLKDILRLEELGVNIWYDDEMHIGENWQEIAQFYISKFQCRGIIFYLTENSISSPACNMEIEYALKHDKKFLSINKPLDGCSVQSGYAMLQTLLNHGLSCEQSLLDNFKKAFPDDVLYLSIDDKIERKAQKICSIEREELLLLTTKKISWNSPETIWLELCRDNTMINLDLSRYYEVNGLNDNVFGIDACVFANSIKLQRVQVSPKLKFIGDNAFRNCMELEDIDLTKTLDINIGNSAFQNCVSLKTIDLSHTESIGENAFKGCKNLNVSVLCGSISANAFSQVPLKKIEYVTNNPSIGRFAFSNSESLEEFNIKSKFTSDIGRDAFYNCKQLKKVGPFITGSREEFAVAPPVYKVESSAFEKCISLETIKFIGNWNFAFASYLFYDCTALREIELDIVGTEIPDWFAYRCKNLQTITNTDHFEKIGEKAFCECKNLQSFDMNNVQTIGKNAFAESGIKKAYLPNVVYVSEGAFTSCENLKSIYVGEKCQKIDAYAFSGCPSLTTVKILSEKIILDTRNDAFIFGKGRMNVKVFYLCSHEVYDVIKAEGVLDSLRYLYVGKNVDVSRLDLTLFEKADSDENGFYKFVQERIPMPMDNETLDIADDELNAPNPNGKKYKVRYGDGTGYVGNQYLIKHLRLQTPHNYFVEDVITTEYGIIDGLVVSAHTGKSFWLDGTLIIDMYYEDAPYLSRIRLDSQDELVKINCCISYNGNDVFCVVQKCNLAFPKGCSPADKTFVRPLVDENSKFILESIVFYEDGRRKAISALDIQSIKIFNENFDLIKILNNS